ncbi:MAG: SDR family oxidoreductase [Planctomycetes bacterium]|nr:SDR family oxidoreductase [Planctomycetota bacterium]
MGRLAAKRCLIVGGTSGIGLAAARRFLQEEAVLVVTGSTPAECATAERELAALGPIYALPSDVTQADQVGPLFHAVIERLGGLDVVYHVAGGSGRKHGDGALHACTLNGWQATIDLNLTSTFLTNQQAVRHFLEHGGGTILNMASTLATSPSPRYFDTCAYAAAKGGVIAMSRLAAARYADKNIRVNVIAPALIDTPMAQRAVSDPAIRHYLRSKQPLRGGPGTPEDCCEAAVFLCGDGARFLTGVVLPVDGGWCLSDGQYMDEANPAKEP